MKKRYMRHMHFWAIASMIIMVLIIIPNGQIFVQLLNKPTDAWYHIKTYLLKDYAITTILLIAGVGITTTIIGTTLAWITTVYDFPFKKFLKWAFILPLAIPPYIGAYTYAGMLSYTGPIQSYLRNTWQIQLNQKYLDIMSLPGSIFIFTLFLFPYVYTITRGFLKFHSGPILENGRVLGKSPSAIFMKVVLPLSRMAIIAGVSLVMLEVLNDYGVVSYYGVPTFSTAIFTAWFGMGDSDAAVRLAALLMLIVFVILYIERLSRGRRQYGLSSKKIRPVKPYPTKGIKKWAMAFYGVLIFMLSFGLPLIQLIDWALLSYKKVLDGEFLILITNTLVVALITSTLIILFSIVIANNNRLSPPFIGKLYGKLTALGYSIPGAVIAIGIMVSFFALDRFLVPIYESFDINKTLVLSSSLLMLICAYIIRFLTIGYNPIHGGFEKIGMTFHEAARAHGKNSFRTFIEVDLPLVYPSILSGFLLVFIETMKELPLTLLLKPFNYNTLATKAYEYANDEMIHEAAVASLIIIFMSFIAIYIYNNISKREG